MFNLFNKTKPALLSREELFGKDTPLPKHIAIIMDGNGRWAKKRGLPRIAGHRQGRNSLRNIVKSCAELKIAYLTVYAFSTENWGRPKEEVDGLMELFGSALEAETQELFENQVFVQFLGNLSAFPQNLQAKMKAASEKTKNGKRLTLSVMVNYGGRAEIIEAMKKIKQENVSPDQINEELINKYLYTKDLPDPDLLIRTASEMRISNFLLWQIAYSEIYVTSVLWPDFNKQELVKAINSYLKRDRKFGKIKS